MYRFVNHTTLYQLGQWMEGLPPWGNPIDTIHVHVSLATSNLPTHALEPFLNIIIETIIAMWPNT